jgi:hypothetical protein
MGWWIGTCLLLLAACGDDGSTESAASTTSATSTSTSTTTSTTTTTTIPVEPGPYVGTFYNVDPSDGSPQEITIEAVAPEGDDGYSYTYTHYDTAGVTCRDVVGGTPPASGTGDFTARTGENSLVVEGLQFYCRLNGLDDEDHPLVLLSPYQVRYEPETDQLITTEDHEFGPFWCWTRERPGPTGVEAC